MTVDTILHDVPALTEQQDLPAGCFSSWLRRIRHALIKEDGVNVHCGECHACCTSSFFIHIRPEETRTLARIPKKLLFPAPGLPKGNVLLGYDKFGRCPMLIDGKCSIYEHRPITCRNYDCRIYTAAGITPGDDHQALITQRIRNWKFSYPTPSDREKHLAVQATTKFFQEHAECFPAAIPDNSAQLVILAIKVYSVFLESGNEFGKSGSQSSNSEVATAIITAYRQFESKFDIYHHGGKS